MNKYLLFFSLLAPVFLQAQEEEFIAIAAKKTPSQIQSQEPPPKRIPADESLAEQATDFTAPLLQLQFQNWYNDTVWESKSSSNTFIIRPIVPIEKWKSIPFTQLIRATVPVVTTPKIPRHITGLGDTQVFDLLLYDIPDWGRIGFGPMAIFPTSTNQRNIGEGKWQLGPAFAAMLLCVPHCQFGFLAQNPYSLIGNSSLKNVFTLYLQPLIAFHFPHNWYLISDAEMTFQWNPNQIQIPVNIGIGKVATIKGQPINAFLETEWVVYKSHAALEPHFTVKAGFHFLFPDRQTKLEKAGR